MLYHYNLNRQNSNYHYNLNKQFLFMLCTLRNKFNKFNIENHIKSLFKCDITSNCTSIVVETSLLYISRYYFIFRDVYEINFTLRFEEINKSIT